MFKKGEKYGLMVLAVVAVVAAAGLVMNLTGLTGAWGWTMPTFSVCSDRFGVTYNSRDYVTYSGRNTYDSCIDSNRLNEAICLFNNVGSTQYDCRIQGKVCQNGACVTPALPATPVCGNGQVETGEQCDDGNRVDWDGCGTTCTRDSCSDTDGGLNRLVQGTVTETSAGGQRVTLDGCGSDGITLAEFYCGGNYGTSTSRRDMNCAGNSTTQCTNGACV